MLRKKITRLVAIVALLSSGSVLAVQFDNRSFEQGSLNGWDSIGDASVQIAAALGVPPMHGQHAALLTTSKSSYPPYWQSYGPEFGTDSRQFLEWLGLSHLTPPYPPLPPDWQAYFAWVESTGNEFAFAEIGGHSGLRQSVELRAGDVVSFDWSRFGDRADRTFAVFYPTASPFWEGTYTDLTAPFIYPNTMTPWQAPCTSSADPDCLFSTGWQSSSFVAPSDGNYTLTFGVFDRQDDGWLTAFWVDNLKISRVPEPSVLSLLALGLAGLSIVLRNGAKRRSLS